MAPSELAAAFEMNSPEYEDLVRKLKQLSQFVWNGECEWPIVETWLEQFTGESAFSCDEERHEMLYLLTNFIYYGMGEVRGLLKSVYRDIVQYRLIEKIRRANRDTVDLGLINRRFEKELSKTRFVPVGNPSESSSHLLYYFRQENGLPKKLFVNSVDILEHTATGSRLRSPRVRRYVLVDDFSGSGTQAIKFAKRVVAPVRRVDPKVEFNYYVLVATAKALGKLRKLQISEGETRKVFDDVDCVFELSEEFKAFSSSSLFYQSSNSSKALNVASTYGKLLRRKSPLGYKNGQLILGFGHNVPNNTLPIFSWVGQNREPWVSPFPRYPKY